jgi:hypothetical protein
MVAVAVHTNVDEIFTFIAVILIPASSRITKVRTVVNVKAQRSFRPSVRMATGLSMVSIPV